MKKSQAGFEFILIIGAVLFIFVLFFAFTFNRNTDLRKLQESVDEKKECIRLSNLISGVYKNGPGTEVTTKTNHVITVYNDSVLQIQKLENTTVITNKIAVLLSESGVSTQTFYDTISASLNPDFYKWCSDDWYGSNGFADRYLTDCNPDPDPSYITDVVNWDLIPKNLSDLIDNLDSYDTVYLEDAHLHPKMIYNKPGSNYNGMDYVSIFQNWTYNRGVLIVSEHFFCTGNAGSLSQPYSDHWECASNELGGRQDFYNWVNFFGRKLHQEYSAGSPTATVVNKTDPYTFDINDLFTMNEGNNINISSLKGTEFVIAKYNSPTAKDIQNLPRQNQSAIIFWPYGSGVVHYIADFEVTSDQEDYSQNLVSIIKNAYFLLVSAKKEPGEYCVFYGNGPYSKVTGNITIKNDDNTILVIQNPT